MVELKINNINRLIAHVEGMMEPVESWGIEHCFAGMIRKHLAPEGFYNQFETSLEILGDWLGCDGDNAETLSYRWNDPCRCEIETFPLEEQKKTLVHALVTLRDTGEAKWLY